MATLLFIIFVITVGCWVHYSLELSKIEYEEAEKKKNRRRMNIDIR